MYYTYSIKSINLNYIYTGISDNPKRRIGQHNKGYNRTTNPYKPFNIILIEQFANRAMARQREKYLKSGVGREYLKRIK